MLFAVVLVVSGALVVGAAWGNYGKLPERLEGFLVALAGGALLLSVTTELIQPSIEKSSVFHAMLGVGAGAIVFAICDYLIDEKWGSNGGGGLLAAITLDGIPENLALGVALIGAGGLEIETDDQQAYLRKQFVKTSTSITAPGTASFTAVTASAPSDMTSTSENDFVFFINGQYMEHDALQIQQESTTFRVIVDTDSIGYDLEGDDEILAFGKLNS